MPDNNFFIGWSSELPDLDRRFFLGSGISLTIGTAAIAGGLSYFQNKPQPGSWNMSDVREFTGIVTAEPYAMLRTADINGDLQTALLGCQGKCGVSARIGAMAGKRVTIKGSLIQRGVHTMIAVVDSVDWIQPSDQLDTNLRFPRTEPLGQIDLKGEILDAKCWFGAMDPNRGKIHKACASLCIRGGLPPAFYVQDKQNRQALMIMTDGGSGFGHDILEFVADPVSVRGELQRRGNLLFLDTSVSAIKRL